MSSALQVSRKLARFVATIATGLTLSAGVVTGGSAPDSTAPGPLETHASPSVRGAWGGIGDAGGGFRVTPTRVVFQDRMRSAELTLVNTGAEPTTYRVSLTHMRMSETGTIEEIGDPLPGEAFADSLVRYSPRQVDLEPGAEQTVRIQLRKSANLPPGEYRSHLVFRALPAASPETEPGGRRGTREVSIALRPVFGAAIPIIVRNGVTTATVKIDDLELRRRPDSNGGIALALAMRRTGNESVYGDLIVTHTAPGGRPRIVGRMRGVAVYTPNLLRRVEVPLQSNTGESWTTGALHVAFEEVADDPELLAEAELALR
jgi:pili/flagellar assembly PapD-like chaperone